MFFSAFVTVLWIRNEYIIKHDFIDQDKFS